jgi:glutamate formiminotransferase
MLPSVMPAPIFESVPNFSEGRRVDVAKAIASAAEQHAAVLDLHIDPDHNRGVLSIAGTPDALLAAVFEATSIAVASIDLGKHQGVHPRLGAMDVIPFVPIIRASMREAAALANDCARRIATELGIPTFLYGDASADHGQLPRIRREAFTQRRPDYGPPEPHASAGTTVVGARPALVAYNINIDADMQVASEIARSIRESDGGLRYVRALALRLESRGLSQVSTNLVRPLKTRIPDVHDAVARMAKKMGVEIVEAELVGLASRDAFGGRDPESVGLNSPQKILEDELARIFEI